MTGADPGAQRNSDAAGAQPAASHVTGPPGGVVPPERVIDTRIVHRGHYLEYRVLTIERPDGTRSQRDIVGHPGAVAIVALDPDDQILFVRQFRLAAGEALLELPAGTLDVDPDSGATENPDAAAARELEEETGFRAGRIERLGEFWTAPGFATELMTLYLATDLRPAEDHDRLGADEDELLELERLSVDDALAAVDSGAIRDAKSIVGILRLARLRGGPAGGG